jgi:hypothetical protein
MIEKIYCCNCNKEVGEFEATVKSSYAKMYYIDHTDYKGRTVCPDCGCYEISNVKTNLEKRVLQ